MNNLQTYVQSKTSPGVGKISTAQGLQYWPIYEYIIDLLASSIYIVNMKTPVEFIIY